GLPLLLPSPALSLLLTLPRRSLHARTVHPEDIMPESTPCRLVHDPVASHVRSPFVERARTRRNPSTTSALNDVRRLTASSFTRTISETGRVTVVIISSPASVVR